MGERKKIDVERGLTNAGGRNEGKGNLTKDLEKEGDRSAESAREQNPPGYWEVENALRTLAGKNFQVTETQFASFMQVGPKKAGQFDQNGDHIYLSGVGGVSSMRAYSDASNDILQRVLVELERPTEEAGQFSFNDLDLQARVTIPTEVLTTLQARLDSSKGTGFLGVDRKTPALQQAMDLGLLTYKSTNNRSTDWILNSRGTLAVAAYSRFCGRKSE